MQSDMKTLDLNEIRVLYGDKHNIMLWLKNLEKRCKQECWDFQTSELDFQNDKLRHQDYHFVKIVHNAALYTTTSHRNYLI